MNDKTSNDLYGKIKHCNEFINHSNDSTPDSYKNMTLPKILPESIAVVQIQHEHNETLRLTFTH